MFTLLDECFEDFVSRTVGEEAKERAAIHLRALDDVCKGEARRQHEEYICRLTEECLIILGSDARSFGKGYGGYFVKEEMKADGMKQILSCCAHSLPDMLECINALPTQWDRTDVMDDVWVTNVTPESFELHLQSPNPHFCYWIEGLVDELARQCFSLPGVAVSYLSDKDASNQILKVSALPGDCGFSDHCQRCEVMMDLAKQSRYSMCASAFYQVFPFHLIMDKECRVVQAGSALRRLFPALAASAEHHVEEYFEIQNPRFREWKFDALAQRYASPLPVLLCSAQGLVLKGTFVLTDIHTLETDIHTLEGGQSGAAEKTETPYKRSQPVMLFIGSPNLTTLPEMKRHGLCLSDLSPCDLSVDLVLLREAWQEQDLMLQQVTEERNKAEAMCKMLRQQVAGSVGGQRLRGHLPGFLGTPADMAIRLINNLLNDGGDAVSVSELIAVRDELLKGGSDLRQPVNLSSHVFDEYTGGDDEVNQSLMNLLVSRNGCMRNEVDDALSTYEGTCASYLDPIVERPHQDGQDFDGTIRMLRRDTTSSTASAGHGEEFSRGSVPHATSPYGARTVTWSQNRNADKSSWSTELEARPSLSGLSILTQRQGSTATSLASPEENAADAWLPDCAGEDSVCSSSSSATWRHHSPLSVVRPRATQRHFSLSGTETTQPSPKMRHRGVSDCGNAAAFQVEHKSFMGGKSKGKTIDKCRSSSMSVMGKVKGALKGLFSPVSQTHISPFAQTASCSQEDFLRLVEPNDSLRERGAMLSARSEGNIVRGRSMLSNVDAESESQAQAEELMRNSSALSIRATPHDSAYASNLMIKQTQPQGGGGGPSKLSLLSPLDSLAPTRSSAPVCRVSGSSERLDRKIRSARVPNSTQLGFFMPPAGGQGGHTGAAASSSPHMERAPWVTGSGDADTLLSQMENGAANRPLMGVARARDTYLTGSAGVVFTDGAVGNRSLMRVPYTKPDSRHVQGHRASAARNRASPTPSSCPSPAIKTVPTQSVTQSVLTLLKEPNSELSRILEKMDNWEFDVFELQRATNGRPLSAMAFHLFKRAEIISRFGMDEQKLVRFFVSIEDGYPPNPYHCREHAADVLHLLHVIATRGGLIRHVAPMQLDSGEIMATINGASGSGLQLHNGMAAKPPGSEKAHEDARLAPTQNALSLLIVYLAAIIHDFDHRGVNNQFLIQTGDPLALLYNDISPMENHHIAAAFMLLREERHNFLDKMPKKVFNVLRTQVIDMVLSTDMKQHFSLVSLFQSKSAVSMQPAAPPAPSAAPSSGSAAEGERGSTSGVAPKPIYGSNSSRSLGQRIREKMDSPNILGNIPPRFSPPATSDKDADRLLAPVGWITSSGMEPRNPEGRSGSRRMTPGLLSSSFMYARSSSSASERGLQLGNEGASSSSRYYRTSFAADSSEWRPVPRRSRAAGGLDPELPARDSDPIPRSADWVDAPTSRNTPRIGLLSYSSRRDSLNDSFIGIGSTCVTEVSGRLSPPVLTPNTSFSRSLRNSGTGHDTLKEVDGGAEETAPCVPAPPAVTLPPILDSEFMALVWKIAIKCADLSNLTNSRPVAKKWVLLLEEEMFRQGDRERAAGLPISALMDRNKAGVMKCQPGFFNVVALPLFSAFVDVFPDAEQMLQGAKNNLAMWTEENDNKQA